MNDFEAKVRKIGLRRSVLEVGVKDGMLEQHQCCGKVDKVCWRVRNKCGILVQIRI